MTANFCPVRIAGCTLTEARGGSGAVEVMGARSRGGRQQMLDGSGPSLRRIVEDLKRDGRRPPDADMRAAWEACVDARDLFEVAVAVLGGRDRTIGRAACACARAAVKASRIE